MDEQPDGESFDSRTIYSFDLDARRTAHIPAASLAEATRILDAYLESKDDEERYQFEIKYVECHDEAEADEEEEAGRASLALLVGSILSDDPDSPAN